MLDLPSALSIDERDLQFEYVRASGPGGQNVNKVATAVQLRFDIAQSSLPIDVKARLVKLAGQRLTSTGELLIEAKRFRTQEQNRADALQRLTDLIRRAATPPKPRKATRPSLASQEKRLESKRKQGQRKRQRTKSFDLE